MPVKASQEDQAHLLELQAIDTKLQQLGHRAKTLPELAALAALGGSADALKAELAEATGAVEDARAELSRLESDVALVEARIRRDTERMQSSSSVKDVAGFESELAGLTKRRFELEEIELSVMERLERWESAVQEIGERNNRVLQQRQALEADRDAALAVIASERAHAEANRRTIADRLPGDLLALYERQRARYGFGASLLRGGVSSASGVKLTEADMAAVRAAAADDVLLCPDSNAILVRTIESGL